MSDPPLPPSTNPPPLATEVAPPIAPSVVLWYRLYCGFMILAYLIVAGLGAMLLIVPPADLEMDPTEARVLGIMYLAIGLALLVVYAIAVAVPRKKWGWIYALVAICLTLTSCACIPAAVPLLIFWLKPECKSWFHVAVNAPSPAARAY